MPVEWRKALVRARVVLSADVATEIPAPAPGAPPHRVRLFVTPRSPAPPRRSGVLRQIVRDFSDRSERGDPGALFSKYGGGAAPLMMSIPFTAAGVLMLVFLPRRAPHQVLPWVFGAIFTLAGLFLFSMGLSGIRDAAGARDARGEAEPWRSDNVWDPGGARPDAPGRSLAAFLGGVLFLLLIGAFNVMWTVRKDFFAGIVVTVILVVFDALGLLMIGSILVGIVQRIRAGSPRLSWKRFPFFTGDRFEATFTSGRALHVAGPVRATLRCVTQVVEEDSRDHPEVHPYAIYAHSRTVEPPDGRLTSFEVSFDLPAGVPGTDLTKKESTYWLLEVRAPLTGPDFSSQFLIPIYARVGSPRRATSLGSD